MAALAIIFVLAVPAARQGNAQEAETDWATPTNLSRSGGATNPLLVVDAAGGIHVAWKDAFISNGLVFTEKTTGNWSRTATTLFPFRYAPTVRLLADSNGAIHAVYIDSQGRLYYSQAAAASFGNMRFWSPQVLMSSSAVVMQMLADANGDLHLVYARPVSSPEYPAGIYYRRSQDGGRSWGNTVALYTSAYIRLVTGDSGFVSIASTGQGSQTRLFVTWDNRARNQVFLIQSDDGGLTWGEPVEMFKNDDNPGSANPSHLQAATAGEQVALFWQNGAAGTACTQSYQWSLDGGNTWGPAGRMLEDAQGCPQKNYLFSGEGGQVILMAVYQSQVYLLAWDGKQWSKPQLQSALSGFQDPDTQSKVLLGCLQAALGPQNEILVVGCEAPNPGDIWLTSRKIGDVSGWFPQASTWSVPEAITKQPAELLTPRLVAGAEGQFHAFWTQTSDIQSSENPRRSLYYSTWDGTNWSLPTQILSAPQGDVANPHVSYDPVAGRLLAVWSQDDVGQVFFSWANAGQARSSSDWSTPVSLPAPRTAASSPFVLANPDGRLWVAYAIRLNEGRGIYLTRSDDNGKTWSEPVQVVNAAQAGWDLVDEPRMAVSEGILNIVWTRFTLAGRGGPVELDSASSEDGGKSWSAAAAVAATPITWSELLSLDGQSLHRIWGESQNSRQVIKHQYSLDGGKNWSQASTVTGASGQPGLVAVTPGQGQQMHLLQASGDSQKSLKWVDIVWQGDHWLPGQSQVIELETAQSVVALSAGISGRGDLGLLTAAEIQPAGEGQAQYQLAFTAHRLEDSPVNALPPTPVILPTATPTPTRTPAPTATPVPALPAENLPPEGEAPSQGVSTWTGLLIGGGVAGLLALGLVIFRMRSVRGR